MNFSSFEALIGREKTWKKKFKKVLDTPKETRYNKQVASRERRLRNQVVPWKLNNANENNLFSSQMLVKLFSLNQNIGCTSEKMKLWLLKKPYWIATVNFFNLNERAELSFSNTLLESLILAQDERWRRA